MKKLLIVVMMISSLCANAQGVAVSGVIDCGQWIDARKKGVAIAYEDYTLGIVDGIALARVLDVWRFDNTKTTSLQFMQWMDNYCGKNPLSTTTNGAWEFVNEKTNGAIGKIGKRKQ